MDKSKNDNILVTFFFPQLLNFSKMFNSQLQNSTTITQNITPVNTANSFTWWISQWKCWALDCLKSTLLNFTHWNFKRLVTAVVWHPPPPQQNLSTNWWDVKRSANQLNIETQKFVTKLTRWCLPRGCNQELHALTAHQSGAGVKRGVERRVEGGGGR